MNELTAKELFALYGPRWAALPECRPKHVDADRNDIPPVPVEMVEHYEFDGSVEGFAWAYLDRFVDGDKSNRMLYEGIDIHSAAALARVAAEDALVAHAEWEGGLHIHSMGGTIGVFIMTDKKTVQCQAEGFENVHHALCAALDAVIAGRKG